MTVPTSLWVSINWARSRVVGGHPGRQLAPVLNVQQHPRHQPGDLLRPLRRTEGTSPTPRKMIDRRHAAFVEKFAHRCKSQSRKSRPSATIEQAKSKRSSGTARLRSDVSALTRRHQEAFLTVESSLPVSHILGRGVTFPQPAAASRSNLVGPLGPVERIRSFVGAFTFSPERKTTGIAMTDLLRQEIATTATPIVVKVGTRVLTHPDGRLNHQSDRKPGRPTARPARSKPPGRAGQFRGGRCWHVGIAS